MGNGVRLTPRHAHVHHMVYDLARDLTLATYETMMGNNQVRARWKEQHPNASEHGLQAAFIRRYIWAHLAPARATLAGMLAQPYDEGLKEKIHEALVLDKTLVRGRDLR